MLLKGMVVKRLIQWICFLLLVHFDKSLLNYRKINNCCNIMSTLRLKRLKPTGHYFLGKNQSMDFLFFVWTNFVFCFQGTNDLREMKYPKVQKYCLMSVRGCYTGKINERKNLREFDLKKADFFYIESVIVLLIS